MTVPKSLLPYIHENEPLAAHTTFKIGGPARLYARPPAPVFSRVAAECMRFAAADNIPFFILGGGANLCVSDKGINALVLDTTAASGLLLEKRPDGGPALKALAGTPSDELARFAGAHSLSGLEFLSGLPGTAGGAVFMNARCFERSLDEALISVEYLDERGETRTLRRDDSAWAYKESPFQRMRALILSARFGADAGAAAEINALCELYRRQREEKGHFRFPSAGSVFKNNRKWGRPSGAIVEELGLRGERRGGAQIAPWHGNFIINTGNATADDVRALVEYVKNEAKTRLGIELEEEILFAG